MLLYWFTQAIAYLSIVVLIVPYRYFKKLFLFGFIGGFLYTWIVQYIAVNVLKYWAFPSDLFMISGVPFFFVLSWFAVTILYGFILYKYPKTQLWIIAFFVLWATINNYISLAVDQIIFVSWSIPHTLMFAVFSHILLLFLLKIMLKVDELGTNEDTLSSSFNILKK